MGDQSELHVIIFDESMLSVRYGAHKPACTLKVSQENCSSGMMLSRSALSKYLMKPVNDGRLRITGEASPRSTKKDWA
ncbi:hypothetical protein C5167_022548 [Papaver somniferum]|uniref:Uncharacterized protein n=1 Tax=Papaver somniferum TaxID=3469 RepID=A0A4Y7JJQ7_PAPSO|nr:hypothetical protein C5167_022548 [Papaver somniferum]